MDFKKLTDEQKKKIAECKTPKDFLAAAKEFGYELTDDQLDKISGGETVTGWCDPPKCPKCGSHHVDCKFNVDLEIFIYHCRDCGYEW